MATRRAARVRASVGNEFKNDEDDDDDDDDENDDDEANEESEQRSDRYRALSATSKKSANN